MANEFKVKNGLIVIGDLTTSGTITINGALAATQSWVTSQAYLTSASLSGYATQSYVTSAISSLIDAAPAALDTLNELAAALGDDANFSTTITNSIANKVAKSGDTMTGSLLFAAVADNVRLQKSGTFLNLLDPYNNIHLYNGGTGVYIDSPVHYWRSTAADYWMTLNTTGLGIGTQSPASKLHVEGANDLLTLKMTSGGYNSLTLSTTFGGGNNYSINPYITGISNGGFEIKDITNNVSRIAIAPSTGNVGIGTTSPDSKLHIEGNTTGSGSGADAIVHIKQNGAWNGNEPWALYVEGYSYLNGFRVNAADGQRGLYTDAAQLGFAVGGNSPISFTQNTSDYRMYIAPGGNIGIGTTTPSSLLNIVASGSGPAALTVQDNARKIKIGRDQIEVTDLSDVVSTMYLQPNSNIVITGNAGNVGIGSQPSYKLDVNGTIRTQTGYILGANGLADITIDGSTGSQLRYGTQKILLNSADAYIYTNNIARLSITNAGIATFSNNLITTNGIADPGYARITNPSGGISINNDPQSAAIKIALPANGSFTNTMISFTVHIFDYAVGKTRTLKIAGYTYFNQDWYNMSVYQSGGELIGNVNVRFGVEGGRNCVWIGETSTYWSYPNVFVTDVQCGHSQTANLTSGWNISFVTTLGTVQNTLVAYTNITTKDIGGTTNYVSKFTGANTLGNSLIFDNGTNVGIGTTTPGERLQVQTSIRVEGSTPAYNLYESTTHRGSLQWQTTSGAVGVRLFNLDNSNLMFGTNNTERIRIDTSGNVGIGTVTPNDKLIVNGNIGVEYAGYFGFYRYSAAIHTFSTDGITSAMFGIAGGVFSGRSDAGLTVSGYDQLRFYTENSERIRINRAGKVSIGTTDTNSDKSDFTVYTGGNTSIALAGNLFRVGESDINWDIALRQNGTLQTYGQTLNLNTQAGNYAVNIQPNGTTVAQFYTDYTYFPGLDFAISRVNSTHGAGNFFRGDGSHLVIGTGGLLYLNYANTSGSTYIFGTTYVNNEQVATRAWVGSQGYLTSVSDIWVNTAGDTMTGTLSFAQPVGLGFANGQYIKDNGAGGLIISSGAAVNITGTSVAVTGATTFSDRIQITSNGGTNPVLAIRQTNAGSQGYDFETEDVSVGRLDLYGVTSGGRVQMMTWIKASGSVGIGTLSPQSKLHVETSSSNVFRMVRGSTNFGFEIGGGAIGLYDYEDSIYRWYVDSIGNVGIGTTSPSTKLDVVGGIISTGTYQARMIGGAGGAYFGSMSSIPVIFQVNQAEVARFDESGNLGVGTTSPGSRLHVYTNSDVWHTRIGGASGELRIGGQTPSGAVIQAYTPGGSVRQLYLQRDGGNVGIGNDNPTATLQINGAGGDSAPTLRLISAASDTFNWASDTRYANLTAGETSIHLIGKANSQYNQAYFGYRHVSDGSSSNMLTLGLYASDYLLNILGNGNVGVGTTSPSQKFVVSNGSAEVFKVYSSGEVIVGTNYIYAAASGNSFYSEAAANFRGIIRNDVGAYLQINGGTSGYTYFSGNVGVGTTNPTSPLEITNTGSAGGGYSMYNASYSAGKLWGMRKYGIDNGNGIHWSSDVQFSSTWYSAIRIGHGQNATNPSFQSYYTTYLATTGGNVGIGTITPQKKLDVFGSAGILASFGASLNIGDFAGLHFGYSESYVNNDSYKKSALVFERTDNNNQGGNASGKIHFLLNNYGSSSATSLAHSVVTIDSDANGTAGSVRMGIGTRNPSTPLHVFGIIQVEGGGSTTFYGTDASGSYARNFGTQLYTFRDTGGSIITTINTTSGVITTTGGNSSNWNTAYGWGNHASAGYLTSLPSHNHDDRYYTESESDAKYLIGTTNPGSVGNFTLSIGNNGSYSYVQSHSGQPLRLNPVGNAVFVDSTLTVSGAVTGSNLNISNWDTAYSWGNHASYSYATTSYVTTQINNLINGAPGALDTLSELATALGNDASFATTVTNSIATKLPLAGGTMSGTISFINDIGTALQGTVGINDFWRIYANSTTTNAGYLEIATSDDGTEPIYVRQYTGVFSSLTRTATLLDGAGNTAFPGNLNIGGFLTESSSLKLKENIETSEGNLEKVVNLRPVTYNKIGSQTTELGLIAEEVAEVYPEFVQYDENGEPIGVNYSRLTAALIGAVKELTNQVQELNKKING